MIANLAHELGDEETLRELYLLTVADMSMVAPGNLTDWKEKLLRELSQGQLLGEFALFRNIPRSATAIAADAVTLMVIPANRLDAMVRTNPALAMAIIKDLVSRMLAAEDRAREAEERARKAEGGGAAKGSA